MIHDIKVRKSFKTSLKLDDQKMKIILEEFLYGRERPPSVDEKNVIEAVLASKELTELVEDLMKEQNNAREHPDDLNITNAKVYNFDASYNIWLVENEERFTDKLSGLYCLSTKLVK